MNSPCGLVALHVQAAALRHVEFIEAAALADEPGEPATPEDRDVLQRAQRQLAEYFAGQRRSFDLPLGMDGTDFQQRVWKALIAIPYGETRSYLDIARDIGQPGALRAVGTANGSNRLPIVIPCHRVINADGTLGGFSSGTWRKQKLLALEAPPFELTSIAAR
jgi:methylated-DNA-[protein]-cysteine S-methyltransferase